MKRTTLSDGLELFYLSIEETRFVHDEIFTDRTYFRHGVALSPGACVVDVGANIGMFALYIHRQFPGSRIVAFEPVPEVFEVLSANVALHGIDARLYPCALGAAPGEATFTFYPNNSVMSGMYADDAGDRATTRTFLGNKNPTLFEDAATTPAIGRHVDAMFTRLFKAQTFQCQVRTLSDVLAEAQFDERSESGGGDPTGFAGGAGDKGPRGINRIDLLKIDVEKAELEVIRGITDSDWARVRQVVIEVHDRDGRLAALKAQLTGLGFEVAAEQDTVLDATEIWTLYGVRPG